VEVFPAAAEGARFNMIHLRDLLSEYTDEEKRELGIPNGAKSRGGRWYVGKTYVGKVIDGRFVAVKQTSNDTKKPRSVARTTNPQPKKRLNLGKGVKTEKPTAWWEIIVKLVTDKTKVEFDKNARRRFSAESKRHETVINSDPEAAAAVSLWSEQSSAWKLPPKRRNEMFAQINRSIRENNLRVKTAPEIYRGLNFGKDATVGKEFLGQFKVGETITLPPSGWSANPRVAVAFSNVGRDEGSNRVYCLLRVKSSDKKGIAGMSISSGNKWEIEAEVITPEAQYVVSNITIRPLAEDSDGKNITSLMYEIELTQLDDEDTRLPEVVKEINNISSRKVARDIANIYFLSGPMHEKK
jgi:hypothetical protein